MKKYRFTLLLILLSIGCIPGFSQKLGLSSIKNDGQALNTNARFHWAVPFRGNLYNLSENAWLRGGIIFKKDGLTFDLSGDRYNHRVYSVGPELGVLLTGMTQKFMIYAAYGLDYYYHHRSQIFADANPNAQILTKKSFWPNEVNSLGHLIRTEIGMTKGIILFGEYYLNDLMNKSFTLVSDAGSSKPYENFEETRFNLGVKFQFIRLKKKNQEIEESEEEEDSFFNLF